MPTKQVNLSQASQQWATRPADQRFASLREMLLATILHAQHSSETTVELNRSEVVVGADGNLMLKTPHTPDLTFSHWGFQQFCNGVGSNARYMRSLKTEPGRAAMNLNRDIAKNGETLGKSVLYIRNIGQPELMSSTSTAYARLFNHEMTQAVIDLGSDWRLLPARPANDDDPNARPATAEDIGKSSRMELGEMCVPSGAYASAQNSFIFVVNENVGIDDGTDGGLKLGFFAENSEVGERVWALTTFLYREVCGNHIVWDASQIKQIRIKHMGDNMVGRMRDALNRQIETYRATDVDAYAARIQKAMRSFLGTSFDDLSDTVFARKDIGLTRGAIKNAYAVAEQHVDTDGNPRSIWGFTQGLTRYSQMTNWQDARDELDKAASRVLALVDAV
jgi:hypothetical protein